MKNLEALITSIVLVATGCDAAPHHGLDNQDVDQSHDQSQDGSIVQAQDAGDLMADEAFNGTVVIAHQGEWTLEFDKLSQTHRLVGPDGAFDLDINVSEQEIEQFMWSRGAPEGLELYFNWKKIACDTACTSLTTVGCFGLGAACLGASVLTVGGVAIPCAVVVGACATGLFAGSVCRDWCAEEFGTV